MANPLLIDIPSGGGFLMISPDSPWPKITISVGDMGMGQNLVPLVNIKIAGKWMFIPLKMVLIGIDP